MPKGDREAGAKIATALAPRDLRAALQELGFTDYEARAYLALAGASPATAYEVAKLAGLPRANVYSVLRTLELRGAIQQVAQDPVRYAPQRPDDYFAQQARKTGDLCRAVAREVRRQSRPDESVYVWVYRGKREVHDKVEQMIIEAREHVWIKAPIELIEPHLARLVAAASRGVGVILIVFGEGAERLRAHASITVFRHEGSGQVMGASGVLLTITTDCKSFMVASHVGEVVGSFARNQAIVYVIETMMLHEIYLAEIYGRLGDALDTEFGKGLAKLRRKYRPEGMELHVLHGLSMPTAKPRLRRAAAAKSGTRAVVRSSRRG